MSRFTSFFEWILRLPLVWGGVVGLAFYASLNQGWIDSPLLKQYMAGHRVEYVIGMMFFIGLAALAMRFLELTGQFCLRRPCHLGPDADRRLARIGLRRAAGRLGRLCPTRTKRTTWSAACAKRWKWSAAKTRPTRSNSICATWKNKTRSG